MKKNELFTLKERKKSEKSRKGKKEAEDLYVW